MNGRFSLALALAALLAAGCSGITAPASAPSPEAPATRTIGVTSSTVTPRPTSTVRPLVDPPETCRSLRDQDKLAEAAACYTKIAVVAGSQIDDDTVRALSEIYLELADQRLAGVEPQPELLQPALALLEAGSQVLSQAPAGAAALQQRIDELRLIADCATAIERLRSLREQQVDVEQLGVAVDVARALWEQAGPLAQALGLAAVERMPYELLLAEALLRERTGVREEALRLCEQARDLWPADTPQHQEAAACAARNVPPSPTPVPGFRASITQQPESGGVACSEGKLESRIWGAVENYSLATRRVERIRGAKIEVVSVDGRNIFPAETNQNGEFEFNNLGCTNWIVRLVQLPGGARRVYASIEVAGLTGGYYSGARVAFRRTR